MTLELSLMLTLTVLGAPSLLLVMLLPTILELRKPKDAGPRLIMPDFFEFARSVSANIYFLEDIEERNELDFLLMPLVRDALSILQSIEG